VSTTTEFSVEDSTVRWIFAHVFFEPASPKCLG
jgi:hypothetical protein